MTELSKQLQEYFEADGREGFEAWYAKINRPIKGYVRPQRSEKEQQESAYQAAKASDRALIVALLEMIERQAEALDFSITEICATGLKAFKESAPIIEIAKKWREKV